MAFRLAYHPAVSDEDLPGIPVKDKVRLHRALQERISRQPARFGKPLRHTLRGLWVYRVGDYRIVYAVRQCEVWVLKIGHRRDVYQRMEARMRTMEQWSEQQP